MQTEREWVTDGHRGRRGVTDREGGGGDMQTEREEGVTDRQRGGGGRQTESPTWSER